MKPVSIFREPESSADSLLDAALGSTRGMLRCLERDPFVAHAGACVDPLQNDGGYPREVMNLKIGQLGADATNGHKLETVDFKKYLKGVPLTLNGRVAHIAKLTCVMQLKLDTTAATMTGVYNGADLFGILEAWSVKDAADHVWIGNVDGRYIYDAFQARKGIARKEIPDDVPDADATPYTAEMSFSIEFAQRTEDGKYDRLGLVPLHLFMTQNAEFQCRIADSLPGSPAGIVIDAFPAAGDFVIQAEIVYLDEPVDTPKWAIRAYDTQEPAGALPHNDWVTEYAAIRYRTEDTGAQDNSDLTDITIKEGGFTTKSAMDATEIAKLGADHTENDLDMRGLALSDGVLDIGSLTPELTYIVEPAYDMKGACHAQVSWEVTRSTHDKVRFLVMHWAPRTQAAEDVLRQLTGRRGPAVPAVDRPGRRLSPRMRSLVPHVLT